MQQSSKKTRVLVLDANQRSALAVTRSLGKLANIEVFTADTSEDAMSAHSRYSCAYFQHPSVYDEPAIFNEWLIKFTSDQQIDWVFPTTEVSSQTILLAQEKLLPCRVPFPNLDTVMSLANKWKLIELAASLKIPHPASKYFSCSSEVNVADITRYPVVIKPCLSRIQTDTHWIDTAVHIADSEATLMRLLDGKGYLRNHAFMIQEFIPGHGAGVFAIYDNGKPVTFFAHRRLREKPPRGGVSTLSESATPDPKALAIAKSLLDSIAWHGVAMVEFRVDKYGTPYLMEVNTRFWGSLQLAIDAGVDFPSLLLQICLGHQVNPAPNYRIGQRLRWLFGDLDSLYLVLRDPAFSRAYKLRRLLDFFTPHPFITRHEVNRIDDLGPAWFEFKSYLRSFRR